MFKCIFLNKIYCFFTLISMKLWSKGHLFDIGAGIASLALSRRQPIIWNNPDQDTSVSNASLGPTELINLALLLSSQGYKGYIMLYDVPMWQLGIASCFLPDVVMPYGVSQVSCH